MNPQPYASTPSQKILIRNKHNTYTNTVRSFTSNYETNLSILSLRYLALPPITTTVPHTTRDIEAYEQTEFERQNIHHDIHHFLETDTRIPPDLNDYIVQL